MPDQDWQQELLRSIQQLPEAPDRGAPGAASGRAPEGPASRSTTQAEAAEGASRPPAGGEPAQSPTPPPHTPARAEPPSPPPQAPLPSPVARPVVDPRLLLAQGPAPRGDSTATRAARAVRALAGSPTAAAREAQALVQAVRQPVTTGRQVMVTSIRGGAGKTTVAALLGLVLARHRGDAVLTLEADPALGTLPLRLGAQQVRWTCADLARVLDPAMSLTDVVGYLIGHPGGGWLLPASQGLVGAQLDQATYRTLMVGLRRWFAVTVVDCETLPAELARTALNAAQARLLVVPATLEGVASASQVLGWLATLPHRVLESTVIVLTQSTPDARTDTAKASDYLRVGGAEVVVLPYDRHLAASGEIRPDHLAETTRHAATALAAHVMDRAVRSGR
ncbi:hypothetical protein [Streptomyces sp. NRRL F-5053]|uniref:nucleotide-binding protein n=1 Tax=Streptomyces sp. NRRL F-5053 TaxID=1463854 RepID=UPI0004C5A0DF|nr:hypothetical protein [Streptomyces sp. NRRL F-5053]